MRRPTKKQLLLVEFVEQGLSLEEMVSRMGQLVASVQMPSTPYSTKRARGPLSPSPLIERTTMTRRVYLADFDVFRSDAFSYGRGHIVDDFGLSGNLMLACTVQIVVGDISA